VILQGVKGNHLTAGSVVVFCTFWSILNPLHDGAAGKNIKLSNGLLCYW